MSEAEIRVPVLEDLREELSAKEVLIAAQRERISSLEGKNEALQSALTEWPNGGMPFPKQDIRSPEDFALHSSNASVDLKHCESIESGRIIF